MSKNFTCVRRQVVQCIFTVTNCHDYSLFNLQGDFFPEVKKDPQQVSRVFSFLGRALDIKFKLQTTDQGLKVTRKIMLDMLGKLYTCLRQPM